MALAGVVSSVPGLCQEGGVDFGPACGRTQYEVVCVNGEYRRGSERCVC